MSNRRLHCHSLFTFTLLVLANPACAAMFSTLSNDKGWIYQVENPHFHPRIVRGIIKIHLPVAVSEVITIVFGNSTYRNL